MTSIIPIEKIVNRIHYIRDVKVMLDSDLSELYGVETAHLKRQVKRNINRFPEDFMFELTKEEFNNLRCQIGISSYGGTRYMPMVFTEQGVSMLSSVLNSERAINVNIQIMRTFSKLRQMLSTHEELKKKIESMEKKYDSQMVSILLKSLTVGRETDNVLLKSNTEYSGSLNLTEEIYDKKNIHSYNSQYNSFMQPVARKHNETI